ncbi:hypothetical protein [Streptomyces sp. NPDC002845]
MEPQAETPKPERPSQAVRLLPWTGVEGKPCYLIADSSGGPVTRLADAVESVQLDMGAQLLAHARELLPNAPQGELRFLAERLTEALHDALRVAEIRGRRGDHVRWPHP